MARNRRLEQQELERDEIADGFHDTMEAIHRHRWTILTGLVVLVALILAVQMWVSLRQSRQVALTSAVSTMFERYAQLESLAPEARTDEARALLTDLEPYIADYSGSALGNTFLLIKGRIHYLLDEYEPARTAYEEYTEKAEDAEQRARGLIAVAYTFENQSFFPTTGTLTQRDLLDRALNNYELAAQSAGDTFGYLSAYALLGEARIHELLGDTEKAAGLYREVIERRPLSTPEANEDEQRDMEGDQAEMLRYIQNQIREREDQLSLASTAQLRLERLEARAGLAEPTVTTTVTAPETATAPPAPAAPVSTPAPEAAPTSPATELAPTTASATAAP